MRRTASVAQLKARLSEDLRAVKGGHEVVITERGVPVARITALEVAERRATRRERLTRHGVLRPGRGKPRKSLLDPLAGEPVGAGVLESLLAERQEGR